MHISDDPRVGTTLVDYRVENVLGRGGMGVVYLAEDLRLKRKVALKLLASSYAEDLEFQQRFLRESELAASLDHPNIVPVYEAGEAGGALFIAMRYVDGDDLRELLREGPMKPALAIERLAQVADALDAAHEHGLVHGDVKPSNILVAPGAGRNGADHVYLVDFGLTTRLSDSGGRAPDGQLQGTIDYVAPEQIKGDPIDGRADVYALACVLYECLTGRKPFTGDRDLVVLFAHLNDPPPSAAAARSGLPGAIDDVLRSALAKSPDERQTTCRELISEAERALGLRRASAVPAFRATAVFVAAVLLVAALGWFGSFRGRGQAVATPRDMLVRIDPSTNRIADRVAVGGRASGVAVDADGYVWVTSLDARTLVRIDPTTGKSRSTRIAGAPFDVAVGHGLAVVVNGPFEVGYEVVDAATGASLRSVRLSGADYAPVAVAAGEDGVWIAASGPDGENVGRVTAPPPPSGGPSFERVAISASPNYLFYITPDSGSYNDAAAVDGTVWLVRDGGAILKRLDERRRKVLATVTLPFKPKSVAADADAVWVTALYEDVLLRIEPDTNAVSMTIPLCRGTDGVASGAGSVWVACALDGVVARIDPGTGALLATIDVGGRPEDVAIGVDGVWVTAHRS